MKRNLMKERDGVVIDKFLRILRSGKDYDTMSMCREAGRIAFITEEHTRKIINRYYNGIISDEMIDFVKALDCNHVSKIDMFSDEFGVCTRESRLIIRYIKRKGMNSIK